MGKDWKYIVYVLGALGVFVIVKLLSPATYDWSVTFAHNDKNPFGTYAFQTLLPGIFKEREISHSYLTLYELKDSIQPGDNIVIITNKFSADKEDTKVLLDHIHHGGTALVSAQNFWGEFSDTLNLTAYDYFFKTGDIARGADSSYLKFDNPSLDSTRRFWFRRDNTHNYLEKFDTLRATVIARNEYGNPVTIRIKWGKGDLILNTTPMAFTNIYLLSGTNHDFVSGMLSYLPAEGRIHRTEYYHLGRKEAASPLRFVLSREPLRWAYYVTIGMIVIFMLFEARRKQRLIPIIKPPGNTSLEFVTTIGNLYYQNNDHKNLAEKKIAFLLDQIRTRYLLKTQDLNDEFFTSLAQKSGNSREDVLALFRSITFIQSSTMISPGQLMDLNEKIERFNHQES